MLNNFSQAMSVEDMWKVIENGDAEREKKHLPIDGAADREIEPGHEHPKIIEYDISYNETEEQAKRDFIDKRGSSIPTLISWHLSLWSTRIVPWVLDHSGGYFSAEEQKIIQESFDQISGKVPCLSFRQKISSDKQWLRIYKGVGCHSGIGRKYWTTSSTDVSLGNGCIKTSIVVHEFLHALGYYHEQSRIDRDSYLKIYMENVRAGYESNFDKNLAGQINSEGTAYDLKSIMQYTRKTFIAGAHLDATMESIADPNMDLGSLELSPTDIIELNRHYYCDVSSGWSTWTEYQPCVQQKWGDHHCTSSRVRICFGTSTCAGADGYGVQEVSRNCKTDSELSKTCLYPAVDGVWATWGHWSKCFSENFVCGAGVQSRERTCNNPEPSNGGKDCEGGFVEKRVCRNQDCPDKKNSVGNDFNNGLGSWKSDDFVTRVGGSPFRNVGPVEDVSVTGSYVYFAKPYAIYTETGKLVSPSIAAHTGQNCFMFHYEMNGRDFPSNAFQVYLQYTNPATGKMEYRNLFVKDGHQGNYWRRQAVTIDRVDHTYEIVIEGKARGMKNEIAVDDVFLDGGSCPSWYNTDDIPLADGRNDCVTFAVKGHCNDNYNLWMTKYCAKTCSECIDRNAKCGEWSQTGECVNNYWMLWNCCKSCHDVCTVEDSALCRDAPEYVGSCPGWAESGECRKNTDWMTKHCYKSCYRVSKN